MKDPIVTQTQDNRGPLAGLRVIDLTRVLSGPFCTMILGDLGADVIKIESPSGDPVRAQGHIRDGLSWYFASFNRNKKSVVLDLYTEEGQQALVRLLETADALVENFRPGTLERMGLSAERLKEINPKLVVASVNGFGAEGPYAKRPAFDFVVQAMSGFMSVNGVEGQEPMRSAPPITDLLAGIYAALGVVAACGQSAKTGQGQHVEVSMMNSVISVMAYLAAEYFATGTIPPRTGNDHPLVAPYSLYRCRDGKIAVAPSNDTILKRFLGVLDLEHLLGLAQFATNADRFAHRDELRTLIEERLAHETQDCWIERFNAAGVPCGKVQNLAEVFADPHVAAQEMVLSVPHGPHGNVEMLGFPIRFSQTPCQVRLPAPELGEHSESVLHHDRARPAPGGKMTGAKPRT